MSCKLRAALAHVRKGIPVFPCKPAPDKSPLTKRGFKDATTDASRVNLFWNAHPGASIGVPTGERFFVLDVDVDPEKGIDGRQALADLGLGLPDTWTVRTPRDGFHFYFQAVEGITNSPGSLPVGIDVRGVGGYVLVPPSPGYTVESKAPIADAPEWLLEKIREPKKSPERVSGNQPPTPILAAGEKIPEGRRNVTLTSIAGRLHDGTRTADQLAGDLHRINTERCTPPLPQGEVLSIAASIHRKAPAEQTTETDPEALGGLDRIEDAQLWGRKWKGNGWKTPRSVVAALIQEGRAHSQKVKDAVRVSISVRNLALAVGSSKNTLVRKNGALDKLEDAGIIRRVKGSGTKSGAFDLLIPQGVAGCYHSPTKGGRLSSGTTLPHPPTAPRLRYSKPVYDRVDGVVCRVDTIRRLGKSAEAVVDILERERGWMSVPDLGAALGLKHHRDLRRRALSRLNEADVVEWSDDSVRLRLDWVSALNRKREEDEEIKDHERDRKKYKKQRDNYRDMREARQLRRVGLEPEDIASKLNIGIEDVRRHLGVQAPAAADPEPDDFIEDLDLVEGLEGREPISSPDPVGSVSEQKNALSVEDGSLALSIPPKVEEAREIRPLRRWQIIRAAVDQLFAERPEFRERRVGQITCALIVSDYLPDGIVAQDKEVETILGERGAAA